MPIPLLPSRVLLLTLLATVMVDGAGSPPRIASVQVSFHTVRLFSPPVARSEGRAEANAEAPALEATMAVFTTWFDQPMYINGNTSRPVLLARPGELESAAMLRCAGATWSATKGRYFFSDTSPPLIVLPSGLNQRSKSPAQLRLEHRRMLNVVLE